ncbi:MAG: DNA-binding protein [Thermoanaerobaculia bacterium]
MRAIAEKTRLSAAVITALFSLSLFAEAQRSIPIAAARAQAQGTTVAVIGLVTVPSGAFRSSSEDEGFAIQDQTGGIWVSVNKNPKLIIKQKVLVTGTLGVRAGKLQIVASNVVQLPGSNLSIATGQIGKATLGSLITVEGTIVKALVADLPYGHKLFLNDGSGIAQVYLNASTDIDPKAPFLKAGRRLRVTGFGSQYNTTYEIEPRSKMDLTPF